MRRSVNNITGYTIQAEDGKIGHLKDLYFDGRMWSIRYFVIDTGNWLPGRQVLLTPHVFNNPEWEIKTLPVDLTKKKIEDSPGIEQHKPVSRQLEIELFRYYGWSPYWISGLQPYAVSVSSPATDEEKPEVDEDPSLRSTEEVIGYKVMAADGDIGHVEDFIIEDSNWSIPYLIVDTKNILPGKKVLISHEWVEEIIWDKRSIKVGLTRENIKNSPEYNPLVDLDRGYENDLFDYYGKLKTW